MARYLSAYVRSDSDVFGLRGARHVALIAAVTASLLAGLAVPALGAEGVAVLDNNTVVDAYFELMAGPGLDPNTPIGADPKEIRKAEQELQLLKAQYARERSGLTPEAKAAYEKALVEKSAALQALYAQATRDMVDLVKWRSPDVLRPRLKERIREYAGEQGLALILERQSGGQIFRREGWTGPESDPIDITQPLIEWLRQKEATTHPQRPSRQ